MKTDDGLRHADVIGRGEGKVVGDSIEGTTETQLIVSQAPGAYGAVPYIPRRFGPVIEQQSRGTFDEHGVFTIELVYEPVAGGPQESTVTRLRGERAKP